MRASAVDAEVGNSEPSSQSRALAALSRIVLAPFNHDQLLPGARNVRASSAFLLRRRSCATASGLDPAISALQPSNPNKTKQNQINPSEMAWIWLVLFVRIGTFQWATANPNKKSDDVSGSAPNVSMAFHSPSAPRGRIKFGE
jgi:hypothetical protein